ncbi:TetR/AcrR family transcriptional regulator [Mycobacterium sp. SMC-2]|nr:TetR/AcrR family transcriptional regulator [Mycobacterium sp. SMC-2]
MPSAAKQRLPRKIRANGERSRQRILEAATHIAAERGYDGTSIALVSERSGLPASSIYWHYGDKDALIAAAIEHSFGEWLAGATALPPATPGSTRAGRLVAMMQRTANGLKISRVFLRLGMLLTLEHRDEERSARRMFLQVRDEAYRRTVASFTELFPELDESAVRQLVTFSMAMTDGLFIAGEFDSNTVDILGQSEMLAAAVLAAADHLSASRPGPAVID